MDKKVLITGASGGIGHSLALRLLKDGYKVYCSARRVDKMLDLEKAGAVVIAADLSNEDSARALADKIISLSGGVDILVNNAGYGLYGPVETVPRLDGWAHMDVNFFSPVLLSQLFIPYMKKKF
jgi:NAD(P)-dependent dehydrogenase (short-subunit alcohol dehydrogenase family)